MDVRLSEKFEIVSSKIYNDKVPTLKYENRYIHSKYDPIKEAKLILSKYNLEEYSMVMIFGAGLGYLVDAIKEEKPSMPIVVIETEEYFGKLIKDKYPDTAVFVNSKSDDIMRYLSKENLLLNIRNILFLYNDALNKIYADYYNKIQKDIVEHLKRQVAEITTDAYFNQLWLNNSIKNIFFRNEFSFLRDYKNIYKGRSAVLVAAGPSVDTTVDKLKGKKIKIFALAPAVNILLKNNIIPDFIVASDANYYNLEHFKNYLKRKDLILFTDLSIHPSIVFNWEGRVIFFNHKLPPANLLEDIVGDIGYIPMGGTISVSALFLIKYLGFSHIYLAGQDFAFIDFKTHCKGTGYEIYNLKRNIKTKTFLNLGFDEFKDSKTVYREDGWIMVEKMNMYKKWMEKIVKDFDIHIENLSNSNIEGIKNIDKINEDINEDNSEFILKSINLKDKINVYKKRFVREIEMLKDKLKYLIENKKYNEFKNIVSEYRLIDELIEMMIYNKYLMVKREGFKSVDEQFVDKYIESLEKLLIILEGRKF